MNESAKTLMPCLVLTIFLPSSVAGNEKPVSGAGRDTIFSDDFESDFPGGWERKGNLPTNASWYTGTQRHGTHSVRLLGSPATGDDDYDCYMQRVVSTAGYHDIEVTVEMGTSGLHGATETMAFAWAENGISSPNKYLHQLKHIKAGDPENDGALHRHSFSLPVEANNNPEFTLIFALFGTDSGDEHGLLDDLVITGQGAGPGRVIIFRDDFESDFPGGWQRNGNLPANISQFDGVPRRGTRSLRFSGSSTTGDGDYDTYMQRVVSTAGYRNVQVSFRMGASGLRGPQEHIVGEWACQGPGSPHGHWHVLKEFRAGDVEQDGTLRGYSFSLPAEAENNPRFMLWFGVYGLSASDQRGYVDDVVVTGQREGDGPFARSTNGLIGHWPLAGDVRDHSGGSRHGQNHGADLGASGPHGKPATAAGFDGRRAWIDVPGGLPLAKGDFTITVRVQVERELEDVPGDILSQYDPVARRGVNFGILSLPGSTASQPNDRNVHFGIDNAKLEPWVDHGHLGQSMYVTAMAVHDGNLYASTCEETGHVYRFDRDQKWIDCGTPDRANGIMSMAVLDGQLYVGSGKYRLQGSALPETRNQNVGGRVYRYTGGRQWEDCGKVSAETETVGGLVAFRGRLYATSAYRPAGTFRYEGGTTWTALGSFEGRRSAALGVHNGRIYTSVWDRGGVFEFDGQKFTDLGSVDGNSQTYGFINHHGELLVATWPKGKMYRWAGGQQWIDVGRLGEEREVMATAHYNGKAYAGTLPLAKVFRYEDGTQWTDIGQLDHTPDVTYRRAWSMAVYRGRLFVGTLPGGRVHSIAAGRVATVDRSLVPGWRHLAAVRRGGRLEIFVDGVKAAESASFNPADYDLTNEKSLRIGVGENDFFNGRLADLRIYSRALTLEEIRQLGR